MKRIATPPWAAAATAAAGITAYRVLSLLGAWGLQGSCGGAVLTRAFVHTAAGGGAAAAGGGGGVLTWRLHFNVLPCQLVLLWWLPSAGNVVTTAPSCYSCCVSPVADIVLCLMCLMPYV